MSTTFNDPVVVNNTLDVTASGAQTASFIGADLKNTASSSTSNVDKIAVNIASTGTWSGTDATNYGLKVETATGGTKNYNIWSGDTSGFGANAAFYLAQSQNAFAIKNGPNAVAPGTFVSESNVGNEITSIAALAIATDGATDVVGIWAEANNEDATLNSMAAIQGACAVDTGSVTDAVNFWANGNGGEGTITNLYGLRVENLVGAANGFAVYTDQESGSTNFALYNAGEAKSYFGGNVGIGTNRSGGSVGPRRRRAAVCRNDCAFGTSRQ